MDNLVKKNERLDDLDLKNLQIIQNPDYFCFGMDAVLLSWFATKDAKKALKILDLGTGSGILPLLFYGKSKNCQIDGVEIQADLVEMARRSIKINGLEKDIHIFQGDLRDKLTLKGNYYDIILSNPPYLGIADGLKNKDQVRSLSRHELTCSLEDLIKASKRSLKDHGYLYLVHRPQRLADILHLLRDYQIEAKKVQFVHTKVGQQANLILIAARKGGKAGLIIDPPLIVYKNQGGYTDAVKKIYGL